MIIYDDFKVDDTINRPPNCQPIDNNLCAVLYDRSTPVRVSMKMMKMKMKMMKIKVKMSMMMMKKVSHDDGYFVMKVIL